MVVERAWLAPLLALFVACGSPDAERPNHGETQAMDLERMLAVPDTCASVDAPALEARLLERLPTELPDRLEPGLLSGLEVSWIAFALELPPQVIESGLEREEILARGALGVAVLVALASPDEKPHGRLDRELFQEALDTYHACSQDLPGTLPEFVERYGDYRAFPSRRIDDSIPKPDARVLFEAPTRGIYLSESASPERGMEAEVILAGARLDGALQFLSYDATGELSTTSLLAAGTEAALMPSPLTCVTCHRDLRTREVNVVDPTQR